MSADGPERLVDGYAQVVFDLDGVIYLIDRPIPGAVEAVGRLHAEGRAVAYATNNASRRSSQVADLLTGMGVPARPDEVLTSAAAAAELLRDRLPAGAPVLVVGAEALRAEIAAVGLTPVDRADDGPRAVVQGYGPQVGWTDLAEATVAVRAGATWIATNTDRTLPSGRGPLPGNGALVAVLRTALGRDPDVVVGKPEPALFATAARRVEGVGRWWWATGWTPTSRAPGGPGWTACSCSPASATYPSCSPPGRIGGPPSSRGTWPGSSTRRPWCGCPARRTPAAGR